MIFNKNTVQENLLPTYYFRDSENIDTTKTEAVISSKKRTSNEHNIVVSLFCNFKHLTQGRSNYLEDQIRYIAMAAFTTEACRLELTLFRYHGLIITGIFTCTICDILP